MIVDAKGIHFLSAREKIEYARREYLTDDLRDGRGRPSARVLPDESSAMRSASARGGVQPHPDRGDEVNVWLVLFFAFAALAGLLFWQASRMPHD